MSKPIVGYDASNPSRVSKHVFSRFVRGAIDVVSSIEDATSSINESDRFAATLFLKSFTRKQESLIGFPSLSEKERESATLSGFLEQERQNAKYNRTQCFGYNTFTNQYESDLLGDRLLFLAKRYVSDILCDVDLDQISKLCAFGNGASALLPRACAHDWNKALLTTAHGPASTTRDNSALVKKIISGSHIWTRHVKSTDRLLCDTTDVFFDIDMQFVTGAVYDTVPKTANIKRVILKEPELNGFIQKGIGALMRKRLLDYGLDLNQSGHHNSNLARMGSETGYVATVDAERASDSITLSLCELMLPLDWYDLLLKARSPCVLIKDKGLVRLDMMSGMGNGFTFELESILFYAIGLACAEFSKLPFAHLCVSIHGDDLIVPSDVMAYVTLAYDAAGIKINTEKTFSEGPFRESCGGNWYLGVSVTPIYVKNQNGTTRGDFFWLYNSLQIWIAERSRHTQQLFRKRFKQLLTEIAHYATNRKVGVWYVPATFGRRTGLFRHNSPIRTNGYRGRRVVTRGNTLKRDDVGAYIVWQMHPSVRKCPTDIVLSKQSVATYGSIEEVSEYESYYHVTWWDGFNDANAIPPLWEL